MVLLSISRLALLTSLAAWAAAAPAPETDVADVDSKWIFFDMPTPGAVPPRREDSKDRSKDRSRHGVRHPLQGSPRASNTTIPAGPGGRALAACILRKGHDGNLYAANGLKNQLVKFDMKTKKASTFTPPQPLAGLGNLQPLNNLWGADEGMYFSQSSANLISLFDYKTHKIKSWKIPTPLSFPLGTFKADDGLLYFCEMEGQKIGSLNHKTGEIKEYPLPIPFLLGPAVMRIQIKREVFFTGAFSDCIGALNIDTGRFRYWHNTAPLSPAAVPSEVTKDKQSNVWFCTWTQNLLHKLNPKTGAQEHIRIPHTAVVAPVSAPFGFGIGLDHYNVAGANQIYFTLATLNRVGRLQLPA